MNTEHKIAFLEGFFEGIMDILRRYDAAINFCKRIAPDNTSMFDAAERATKTMTARIQAERIRRGLNAIIPQRESKPIEPPRIAEFLVGVFAKKRYKQSLLSDLDEVLQSDLSAGMSVDRARLRYWSAALRSVGPQLFAIAKRLGFFGIVFDWARHIFH